MTFNTKDLRDGHLPLVERIDIALRRVTNGEGQMSVPVEATDPDIVLHNCRDRITELEAEISRRPLPPETRIDVHAYDTRISELKAELDAKDKRIAEMESNENFKIDLMNGLREDLSQAQRLLGVDRQRNAALESELSEARALLRDAVAQTLAGNALAGELVGASARIAQLEREIDGRDKRIAELDAEVRKTHSEVAGLRAGPQAAKVAAWSTVWDLQSEHVNTWRDKAEWYWFARFSEEVGELGGALVGNHEGPVEWELSQVAAIALNWLDMRADRAAKGGR